MNNTTQVVLNINSKVIKKFEKELKELDGESFQEWLETEFNTNGDALFEMLLGDYWEKRVACSSQNTYTI